MSNATPKPSRLSPLQEPQALQEDLQKPSRVVLHPVDAFAKAYAFTRADEAAAVGMHPYFKSIAKQNGGRVEVDGREMVITGSNDYLGLTQDSRLKDAARGALDDFGTSCTGSRFLTGTLTFHEQLEQRLATFLGKTPR